MKQVHGGNLYAYEAEYGKRPLDFSANINPLGMPDEASAACRAALETAVHYPDPDCAALREAIASHEHIGAGQILCGNGAADLIYRFVSAVKPRTALLCAPAFSEYARALTASGCSVQTHILLEADGFHVTDTILPAMDGIEALCLCNPNNPTGLTIPPPLLTDILRTCAEKGAYILLDECFIDFVDAPHLHSSVSVLAQYPRLVLLKAFTKFYAMPGLRLGYAMCADEALLLRMQSAGAPWSVSIPAQAAGTAALSDKGYIAKTQALIQSERSFMKQMLRRMGFEPLGEANFLFFKAAPGLPKALLEEGLLVRDCANFDGLDAEAGWVRVAIRTRPENMRLLSRLSGYAHG